MGKTTDAREKFKRADQLFRDRNFSEALVVLDELDDEFPDTKNVIYPRAMCLARVGRFDEALELCRQLKVEFGDPRGEKLMGKIGDLRKAQIQRDKEKKEPATAGGPAVPPANVFTLDSNAPPLEDRLKGKNVDFSPVFDPHAVGQGVTPGAETLGGNLDAMDLGDGSPVIDMAALDDLFAAKPAATAPPPIMTPPPSRKGLYIGIGVGAALIVLLLVSPLLLGGGGPAAPSSPQPAQAQPEAAPGSPAQSTQPQLSGPEIEWLDSIEAASSAADEAGNDILLVIYSRSNPSPDMELMDTAVWTDPSIRYVAKDWICAKIDVDKEPEVQERYKITKLPTTILTDYTFEESYYRHEGLVDTHEFYSTMLDEGLVYFEEEFELPALPTIALVLLPILYLVATFFPVLFTLMIFGRLPDDDLLSGILPMILVGVVSPFLGVVVMRTAYQLERHEVFVYYVLLSIHVILFFVVMSLISGFPFHVYLAGLVLKAQGG